MAATVAGAAIPSGRTKHAKRTNGRRNKLTSWTKTSRTRSLHRPGSVSSASVRGTFTSSMIWRMVGFLRMGNIDRCWSMALRFSSSVVVFFWCESSAGPEGAGFWKWRA